MLEIFILEEQAKHLWLWKLFKFLKSNGKKPVIYKKSIMIILIDEIRMLRKIGDTFHAKKNRKR